MKLLVQDLSHCLEPGHKMLERRDRPILFKELKKVWENDRQWRFKFDPSNTLLVDNYPSTALLNPVSLIQYHFPDLQSHLLKGNVISFGLLTICILIVLATHCNISPKV